MAATTMRDEEWLLDSGASKQMTGDARGLTGYNERREIRRASGQFRARCKRIPEAGAEPETT